MTTPRAKAYAPSFDGVPDDDLIELTLNGEVAAFEAIMRRNNRRLFLIARGILGVDADAEDAVQECYVNAYLNLSRFEGRSKLSTWLSRMVVNEALGQIRRRKRLKSASRDKRPGRPEQENVVNLFSIKAQQPEEQVSRYELRRLIEDAVDRLPQSFRTVFLLREVEGMTVSEIAETLDLAKATVKTRNFRARKQLRKELEQRLEPAVCEAFLFLGARCNRMVARVFKRLREIGAMKI